MNACRVRVSVYPLLVIMVFSSLVAGCAGMAPYEPRNSREDGPENGLFSGEKGEFVIIRKDIETATDQ